MVFHLKRRTVKLLLAAIVWLSFSQPVAAQADSCQSLFSSGKTTQHDALRPSKEELLANLWAVHATNYFPHSGKIAAGFTDGAKDHAAVFRPGVHVALGELVIGHDLGNWDTKHYAVLLPLKGFEDRIYSLLPQDTAIMGDITLPKEAVVLVPKNSSVVFDRSNLRIRTYDPATTTLREAIDKTLKEVKAWRFKATGGDLSDQVRFRNQNINTPEFFEPLLKNAPGGFKLHGQTVIGRADVISQITFKMLRDGYGWESNTLEARYELAEMEKQFRKAKNATKKFKLSDEVQLGVTRNIKHFDEFMNVMRAEFWARLNLRKTFHGVSDKSLLKEYFSLRRDPEALKKFLVEHSSKLSSIPEREDVFLEELTEKARSMAQIETILKEQPELITTLGGWPAIRADWQLRVRRGAKPSSELVSDEAFIKDLSDAILEDKSRTYQLGGTFLGMYRSQKALKPFKNLPGWRELETQLNGMFAIKKRQSW